MYMYADSTVNETVYVCVSLLMQIKLSFLPVGHTHEDIDQMFSRFSTYLNKHDAITPSELFTALQNSYSPSPVLEQSKVLDVKGWLGPHIEDLHGHTHPHHFRLQLVKESTNG